MGPMKRITQNYFEDHLWATYKPSYLELTEIVATQIKVPCINDNTVPFMGFLDPTKRKSKHLRKYTNIELPLWLAMKTCKSRIFRAKLPKNYQQKDRHAILADPGVLDLNKWGPSYYQTGIQLICLPHLKLSELEDLVNIIPRLARERFVILSKSYQHNQDALDLESNKHRPIEGHELLQLNKMDEIEKRVYKDSQRAFNTFILWKRSRNS